jgi:hypothetical protein
MNMYPSEVYLVGGGVPLAIDNRLVGRSALPGCLKALTKKPRWPALTRGTNTARA